MPLLVAGLLLFLPSGVDAQWVFGVQGGFPGFTVSGRAPDDASFGRRYRVGAAAVLGYRFGSSVVLRTEPGFVQKGAAILFEVDGVEEPVDSLGLDLEYVSVPVVVQVFTPGGRGFVTTGVELGFLNSATVATKSGSDEVDVKSLLAGEDLSWMFGAGGLVRRSSPEVGLELRYSHSLRKVFEGTPGSSGLPDALRSSGITLLATVSWSPGGDR